jgi:D-glycero-alpha-D-manno-heptose 1-phosphate guanylyltransferase
MSSQTLNMQLIVLCGGLGTRLGPLTRETPKPMLQVAGRPFLAHVLDRIHLPGISSIVLAVGFQWEKISSYVGNHWNGIPIHYAVETQPLGTGGAIKNAMTTVGADEALIVNGDTLFPINLISFIDFAKERNALVCLALRPVDDCSRYGRVTLGSSGEMLTFGEKGFNGAGLINGGVYYIRRKCFDGIMAESFSFETDFLATQPPGHPIYAMTFDNYFIDIGIPSDLLRAEVELQAMEES